MVIEVILCCIEKLEVSLHVIGDGELVDSYID